MRAARSRSCRRVWQCARISAAVRPDEAVVPVHHVALDAGEGEAHQGHARHHRLEQGDGVLLLAVVEVDARPAHVALDVVVRLRGLRRVEVVDVHRGEALHRLGVLPKVPPPLAVRVDHREHGAVFARPALVGVGVEAEGDVGDGDAEGLFQPRDGVGIEAHHREVVAGEEFFPLVVARAPAPWRRGRAS
jgi:hypothetical protein